MSRAAARYAEVAQQASTTAITIDNHSHVSIGNRDAAEQILPFGQEKGMGVLINVPFGGRGRSFFPRLANVAVPDFAQEFDAGTWAQFMLKFVIANPAVSVACPGTGDAEHMVENLGGGRGRLPTPENVRRMIQLVDGLPMA